MTTLTAIAFTLVGGIGVFSITLASFGYAVANRSTFIAARCEARPRNVIYNPKPSHPCQYRGNPMLGWILWVMRLSFDTMLRGVPGTGTRNGGLSGTMLKVNLDGIVLLRFHHLCLRICSLAAFLYLFVVLPLYATAQCSRLSGDLDTQDCQSSNYNLTDYQRLTLANVPTLEMHRTNDFKGVFLSFFLPDHDGNLARLYAAVFVSWIITWYTMHQLTIEWADVQAMRRVYYLEADHWGDRREELTQTLLEEEDVRINRKQEDIHMTRREPWIPHPEQRDTVPNVALYSLLVGGLPSLPTEVVGRDDDIEAIFSRKQSIDWQLSVTTAFFDHCVPNQPGFSSSVAAVTILPAASHLAEAWNNWYTAASKLRRLRFIRQEIADRREYEIDTDAYPEDGVEDLEQPQIDNPFHKDSKNPEVKNRYYQEVLGAITDVEVENNLLHALNFGPEQTAVYSREFAQGAANLAPNGCCEGRIRRATIDELVLMEYSVLEEVHAANLALRRAQERIADEVSSDGNVSDNEMQNIMFSASVHGNARKTPNRVGMRKNSKGSGLTIPSYNSSSSGLGCSSSDGGDSFALDEESVDSYEMPIKDNDSYTMPTKKGDSYEMPIKGDDSYGPPIKDDDKYVMQMKGDGSYVMPLKGGNDIPAIPKYAGVKRAVDAPVTSPTKTGAVKSIAFRAPKTEPRMLTRTSSRCSTSSKKKSGLSSMPLRNIFSKRNLFLSTPEALAAKTPKANLESAQLPTHLGLEAGLWMEQKTLSKGNSQHQQIPRSHHKRLAQKNKLTPFTKDDMDSLHDMQSQLEAKLGNAAERRRDSEEKSGAVEGVKAEREIIPSLSRSHSSKGESKDGAHPEIQDADSFWEKLEVEKRRKAGMRAKLTSMQNSSGCASSTDSDSWQDEGKGASYLAPQVSMSTSMPLVPNLHEQGVHSVQASHMEPIEESADDNSLDLFVVNQDSKARKQPAVFDLSSKRLNKSFMYDDSLTEAEESIRITLDFETKAGLRQREVEVAAKKRTDADRWGKVEQIVAESSKKNKTRRISNGYWKVPTFHDCFLWLQKRILKILCWVNVKAPGVVDDFRRDSTFAVVTFTSRQAAVAARHCLADSRGADRWTTVSEIPVPPLADAAVFNLSSFRGCVRPVTISINDQQKLIRHQIALLALAAIYFFYTIPLVAAQALIEPENLKNIFPDIEKWQENSAFVANIFSGLLPALVWTAFFAICPAIFKIVANFGSNATSVMQAENIALQYFWWFMLLAAFSGTSLSTAVINGFNEGIQIGAEVQEVIETTAVAIPTQVSATWLNWMIVRFTIVLPTQYLLQMNTFLFSWLGLKCCSRVVRGGGSGAPVPYRIYVDSSVVMLCLFALAPASPLIAAAAFCYFLICTPMLRWTMIFLYKPKFDMGGYRFKFIFDMCVSGMVVGQILLIAMMSSKRAAGPALAAAIPLIPTIAFRYTTRKRYLRSFDDVALLQSSLLDGWDTNEETSEEKREEFRRFLVDSHKAAYVPVCIASEETTMMTAEPAAVIPLHAEEEEGDHVSVRPQSTKSFMNTSGLNQGAAHQHHQQLQHHAQPGKMLRRTSANFLQRGPVTPSSCNGDEKNEMSFSYLHSPTASPRSPRRKIDMTSPHVSAHLNYGVSRSPGSARFARATPSPRQSLLTTPNGLPVSPEL